MVRTHVWQAIGVVGVMLAAIACAPAAPPTATPAPPEPTAAPSKPSEPAAQPTQAAAAKPATKPPETTVKVGYVGGVSDAGIFIGIEKGYFAEQGVKVELERFDSAARMVAPLSAGQLDVGAGAPSAGLMNANAREVAVKIVADKGNCAPGHGFSMMLVRKDLYDSGKVTSAKDFKGLKVSVSSLGITPEVETYSFLKSGGLSVKDVELVAMGFPDMVQAFSNKAVDAGIVIEPFASRILSDKTGVSLASCDRTVPNEQTAVILYSPKFATEQVDAGNRFMVGYLKGVRDYNDAFVKKDPAKRKEVVDILIKHTTVKEAALYDSMVMPGLNPNGEVNLESLQFSQEYWVQAGHQRELIDLRRVVDNSFAQSAVKVLGPYR